MFFNPLFLQVINNQESLTASKTQKLNGASYLFSDIIKVCFDKADGESTAMGNDPVNSPLNISSEGKNALDTLLKGKSLEGVDSAEATLLKLLQQIFPQKFAGLTEEKNASPVSEINNLKVNTLQLNENEVTALISGLINNNYQGKLSIISNKNDNAKSNLKSAQIIENNKLSPAALLDLLKEGIGISLESPNENNKQGLLISLVDIIKQKVSLDSNAAAESSGGGVTEGKDNTAGKNTGQTGLDPDELTGEHIYQVELSLIGAPDNSNFQLAFNNITGPSTAELQELINSKTVKLQESLAEGNNNQTGATGLSAAGAQLYPSMQPAASTGSEDVNNIPNASPGKSAGIIIDEKVSEGELKSSLQTETHANTDMSDSKTLSAKLSQSLNNNAKLPNNTAAKAEDIKTDDTKTDDTKTSVAKAAINKAGESGLKVNAAVQGDGPKAGIKADDLPVSNSLGNEELKAVQSKKSKILKDINLSIKAAKFQKMESESPVEKTEQQSGIKLNKAGAPEINQTVEKNAQNIKPDEIKETEVKLNENVIVKQPVENSPSAKDNKILNSEAKSSETESANNAEKNAISKENGSGAEKGSNPSAQEQHASAQEKPAEFKSKLQDGQNTGNDFIRNVDGSERAKTSVEAGIHNSSIKTVKAAEIMKEISRFIQQNSDHTLTLKIEPESLGSVKIALDVVNKLVHANIEVDNEAARKMVETNLNQLYNSLNQNGIQLSSLNISMANYDHKQSKGSLPKRKNSHFNEEVDYNEQSIGDSKKLGYNTYEYLI